MKPHPRAKPVQRATNELREFLQDLEQQHELTYGELFSVLSINLTAVARHLIHSEREITSGDGGDNVSPSNS